ncbi:hypothetical protein [Nonomuraea sp. NPDC049695]|uniref:hypothetical protein n=1 Tax=Nonomuraea sp. NPDC049695 TaxID=3154734 RepID=UPI00342597A8
MSAIDIRLQEVATINRPRRPAPAQGATWGRLLPVLDGLSRAMPADDTAGPAAVTAADVETWQQATRAAAMDPAVRRRADALFTWSIGATALDAVNIDAGYGHQHVFLPTSPGEGALTPDTEPERSHDS